MGGNLEFITDNIVAHVWNYDPTALAAALAGCGEDDCDVRTYGGATSPNWARFFSKTARSPMPGDGFWWNFELIGNDAPQEGPDPLPGTSPPYWGFRSDDDATMAGDGLTAEMEQDDAGDV